ncbi:MAG: dioxygenase [Methylibium sp. NZG]|nr:MAG: dioxygenase [Methylibium sp. NZG]
MNRLTPATLATLGSGIARPRYARETLRCGIVHLGIGGFARAHLAAVTETALNISGEMGWGIVGVSLRHPDTHAALAPQGGLYTLALRDTAPDGTPREALQVIGALMQVLVAPDDPLAVLQRIAHPDTRIVSLTITEKGYHHAPATGALNLHDPDIAHDLDPQHANAPRTAVGFIVRGLQRRHQRGLPALTLLSCDNLPANGDTLRGLVLAFAQQVDGALQEWIAVRCTFPNSMVDRIVPRTTDADRERIGARLGLRDAWPVVAEPFMEWVVEDRFCAGRPPWELGGINGGARFVPSAQPFERLKLRMVNGSHSTLAYLGFMAGLKTVDEAVTAPALRRFVEALMREEIEPTLQDVPGLDLADYRARLLRRFANPALQHQTNQIAMDGSQKLPQRLLGTVADRLRDGQPVHRLALAVAAWIHHLSGSDETGVPFDVQDPLADALALQLAHADAASDDANDANDASVADGVDGLDGADGAALADDAGGASSLAREQRRIASFCAFTPVFGALGSDPRFVRAVAQHTLSLRKRGVLATLERCA